MILITGATGQLGRVVIEHLTKHGDPGQVCGLVRDESKATDLKAKGIDIRVGDYNDLASLDAAMQDVDRILLISGTEMDLVKSVEQHANVIEAARRVGARFIAYTGRAMRDPAATATELMRGHFQTEDLIRASGMTYALFRNALYLESIAYFIGKGRPQSGERVQFETDIRLPAGDGKVAYTLRSELGEAIATALLEDRREDHVYTLTNINAWSFDDMTQALSELSGQPVTYIPTDSETFESKMRERGLPPAMIRLSSGFYADIRNGQLDEVTPELEELLGRPPATLKTGLKALFDL